MTGPLVTPEGVVLVATTSAARLSAPTIAEVTLRCPICGSEGSVLARIGTRVTVDDDGTGSLALRVKSTKAAHLCGTSQLELPLGEEAQE